MKNAGHQRPSQPDYIIIGAGSAGCVLANRLSEHHKVTLLEAGPPDHAWDFRLHMPAALSMVLTNDTYNWYYHSEPEPGLANRRLYCPRGRVSGGSSSINGMIYVRGNPLDFDEWSEDPELKNWDHAHCLPYFKKSETALFGDPQYRGHDGPMTLSRGKLDNPLFHAWLQAGHESGFNQTPDFNGAAQEGVGVFDRSIQGGKRWSTARAYLRPALQSSNLQVINHATATRLLGDGGKIDGVDYRVGNRTLQLHANKEVILCLGAINTPKLLQLSGIGDRAELEEIGIQPRHHLPGVGKNLQDHLEIYVQYACKEPVSIYPNLKWYRKPFVGLQWYLNKTGPAATNHFEAGAFLRSSPAQGHPDLQFHFLPVAMNYDGSDSYEGHGFQVHVGPMKPVARGSVQLANSNPLAPPLIRFNYNQLEADRKTMAAGIELARKMIAQPAFDAYRAEELRPGIQPIPEFVEVHAESAYHPSCSCAMGSGAMAVVNGNAEVIGLTGLRVVDASIMPTITNGNLNAPVIMMAEKLADAILGVPPLPAEQLNN